MVGTHASGYWPDKIVFAGFFSAEVLQKPARPVWPETTVREKQQMSKSDTKVSLYRSYKNDHLFSHAVILLKGVRVLNLGFSCPKKKQHCLFKSHEMKKKSIVTYHKFYLIALSCKHSLDLLSEHVPFFHSARSELYVLGEKSSLWYKMLGDFLYILFCFLKPVAVTKPHFLQGK